MTKASGDKVKLPREVAEAIERFRSIGSDNADIIFTFASGEDQNNRRFADYAADNFDTLLNALVNGYEVEQSKEDKVREVITSFCNGAIVSNWVIEEIQKIYEGDA